MMHVLIKNRKKLYPVYKKRARIFKFSDSVIVLSVVILRLNYSKYINLCIIVSLITQCNI